MTIVQSEIDLAFLKFNNLSTDENSINDALNLRQIIRHQLDVDISISEVCQFWKEFSFKNGSEWLSVTEKTNQFIIEQFASFIKDYS